MNVPRVDHEQEPPRAVKVLRGAGGFRQWASAEESETFARNFSKALIESLVRGEGAVAVWIDGQIVWHTRR
jgi:hypothetical protein